VEQTKIHPFNNNIETGLRILAILNASFPKSFDLQTLLYLDYLTVHSGDMIDGIESLHPAVPSRKGEIFVRRTIINEGLDLLVSKGLIVKHYEKDGIKYSASESSTPFIESLSEEYFLKLYQKANWVIGQLIQIPPEELASFMTKFMVQLDNNFILDIKHHE